MERPQSYPRRRGFLAAITTAVIVIAAWVGRYIVEFSYGDVFARPNLDLKTRELATVAALTAKGTAADTVPLKVHVHAALNVGANRQEIVEAIMHMLPYAGFVSVQQAMTLATEVFSERGLTGGSKQRDR